MTRYSNSPLKEAQRNIETLNRSALRRLGRLCLAVIIVISACTRSLGSGRGEPVLIATDSVSIATVEATRTPVPSITHTALPVPSPSATTSQLTIPTPTLVPSTVTVDVTGRLLVTDDTGIQEVLLPDGNSRYLLHKEEDWVEWGARFGQNQKTLAYWMAYENRREVWLSPLYGDWKPKRILIIEDDFDGWLMGNWAVNDRYLLTSAAILDDSSPLEDYIIVRTYIYDIQEDEFVAEPYWPGACMTLAPSPQTEHLALWCSQSEDTSHPRYLVLEPETSPWIAEQTPQQLSEDCHSLLCAWSADGNYVAYIIDEHVPESLYYSTVGTPMAVHLKDDENDFLRSPLWSPNSAYILYFGASMNRPNPYTKISAIGTPEVVWRGVDTSEELGLDFRELAVWSPDSRYIARAAFSFLEDKNLIVLEDISIGREVGRVNTGLNPITDMIWLETHSNR